MELVTVKFPTPPRFVMFAVVAYSVLSVVLPDTVRFVSVPSVVMFGWFDVVTVALIVFDVILFATVRFCIPPRLPIVALTTLIAFAVTFPLTVIALNLPNAVILSSVPCDNNPLKVPPTIVPGTERLPINPFNVLNAAEVILPDTVRFVNVPKVVMFGWFDVVIVALIVPALMLFATFKFCSPLMLVRFASGELNTSAVTVPVAVRLLV